MEFLLHPTITQEEWNGFVVAHCGSFLQSWQWGEFQKKFGNDFARALVKEDGKLLLCANIIEYSLPLGKRYWYIPYGPVVGASGDMRADTLDFFVRRIQSAAPKDVIFIKIEPDADSDISLAPLGFAKSPKDIQTTETMIMDLSLPEEELLANMKQKTRYNIKLAARHEVKIVSPAEQEAIDPQVFLALLFKTADRNRFRPHPEKYYTDMMELFLGKETKAPALRYGQRLFFAQAQGEIIAAALVGFFGNRATYLHGASSDTHKNMMAPYLLHWEIMRYAKARGFSEYDLWGIATEKTHKASREKWEGFSRFKTGFAGAAIAYPGAYDLPLNSLWYTAYKIARRFRI